MVCEDGSGTGEQLNAFSLRVPTMAAQVERLFTTPPPMVHLAGTPTNPREWMGELTFSFSMYNTNRAGNVYWFVANTDISADPVIDAVSGEPTAAQVRAHATGASTTLSEYIAPGATPTEGADRTPLTRAADTSPAACACPGS